MAQSIITIDAVDSCYTDSANQNSNFSNGNLIVYKKMPESLGSEEQKNSILLFGNPAAALNGKKIISAKLRLYVTAASVTGAGTACALENAIGDKNVGGLSQKTWANTNQNGTEVIVDVNPATLAVNQYNDFPVTLGSDLRYFNLLFDRDMMLYPRIPWASASYAYLTVNAHSSRGANKPQIQVVVDDAIPKVINAQPTSGFVNDKASNRFSWGVGVSDPAMVYGAVQYSGAKFRWRPSGQTAYTEISVSGALEYTVPANTFPNSPIEWQVVVISSSGAESAPSAWYSLSTTDAMSTAEILSPKAVYLTGGEDHPFTWIHSISTGTAQTKAELQVSTDNATWAALSTVTGAEPRCVIAAGTLLGGNIYWRVRTYNSDHAAGAWSDSAPIMVYASPAAPSITPPEGLPRPTVIWQAPEQQAFEVRAGAWTSGKIFGTAKRYKIPIWISNGPVEIGVRIQSSLGLWSDWATVSVNATNPESGSLSLSYAPVVNGARLYWSGTNCEEYILYRDGNPVARTKTKELTDWFAVGDHLYSVRGVLRDGYILSAEIPGKTTVRNGVISSVDAVDWVLLKLRRGSPPTHTDATGKPVTLRYFAGRKKPVAEVADYETREHTLDYSFRDFVSSEKVRALLGKTVIYKDATGACFTGVLQSVTDTRDWAVDTSLSIVETDWSERND